MIARAGITMAERGFVPLPLLRLGVRALCRERLATLGPDASQAFRDAVAAAPIAASPEAANAQHYEVPAEFFHLALGRQLKYSSAYWPEGVRDLDAAEEAMLALTCERAGIRDGQEILELGCGWGSLTLYMARRFPNALITAVSNSHSQRDSIMARAPGNVRVITADMNRFEIGGRYDRIVSVEMFEHMRDWPALLTRVSRWLAADGRLFVHVFCHARHPYVFETEGDGNWMGRHFFTGGIMPSFDLLRELRSPLAVEQAWWLDGTHYARTAAAWRENLEARRPAALRVLGEHYGGDAERWYQRWRLFFLACEELFAYEAGAQWGVGHYLMSRRPS